MKTASKKTAVALAIALMIPAVTLADTKTIGLDQNQLVAIKQLALSERQWLAEKIYINECAANPKYLTYWGKGEEFPSFGIGHFIWYADQSKGKYQETFPQMFNYVSVRVSAEQQPPQWLVDLQPFYAPWLNKQQFDQALGQARLKSLRQWLQTTRTLQADFIVEQFQLRLTTALVKVKLAERQYYRAVIERMFNFKNGRFALIDYVNFKGVGNDSEQYQGQQWGLFSVLKQMQTDSDVMLEITDQQLLDQFINAAKQRLQLRVELAPKKRGEQRWLKGWFKRLDGYR